MNRKQRRLAHEFSNGERSTEASREWVPRLRARAGPLIDCRSKPRGTRSSALALGIAWLVPLAAMGRSSGQEVLRPLIEPGSTQRYEVVTETTQILRLGEQRWETRTRQTLILERTAGEPNDAGEMWVTFQPRRLSVEVRTGEDPPITFDSARDLAEAEPPGENLSERQRGEREGLAAVMGPLSSSSWRIRLDADGEVVAAEPPDLRRFELPAALSQSLAYQLDPEHLKSQAVTELHPFPDRPLRDGDRFRRERVWRAGGIRATRGDRGMSVCRRRAKDLGDARVLHHATWTYRQPELTSEAPEEASHRCRTIESASDEVRAICGSMPSLAPWSRRVVAWS
ncbi:MAG: hypothetical protein R3B96_00390 [Pirellulaceae bacterium]